eukprot:COSAG01_NODE_5294_length_4352_cov_12.531860_3_plen_148_part_00
MRRNTWQTDGTDEPDLDHEQGRHQLPIFVKPTGTIRGKGAFASRDLVAGEFIGEYSGEILCDDELDGTARAASQYVFSLGGGCVVDALRGGNATRRMNHSEDSPNVCATVVNHRGVRKVCMRAKANIAKGTELTFSYGRAFKFKCNG